MAETYDLPDENVVQDWRELAARPRFADAVIISTQDAMHVEPAVAFAKRGYAILLEKPIAPDFAGVQAIIQAVKDNGNLFGVCHVIRYTTYTQT
jgi:predicted dehydrogenase